MSELPPPVPVPLQEAPGDKGAKICGILSLVAAVTCIGFPVAIVLGIVALVKQGTAKRRAREAPGTYRMPSAAALAMGIIGLVMGLITVPVVGIGAAVAIPAFMVQRDHARAAALQANMQAVKAQAEQLLTERGAIPPDQLAQMLLTDSALAQLKNPFDPKAPALELAPAPSQNGAVALSFDAAEGIPRLLLNASYTVGSEPKQISEVVELPADAAPPAPQEEAPQPENP